MSALGETTLVNRLSDFDSLDDLAVIGLPLAAVPTEDLQKVVKWALDYYFASGRTRSPSPAAIEETWGQLLSDNEVEKLDLDEANTMSWAIEDLKGDYGRSTAQIFARELVTATAPKSRERESGAHKIDVASVIHEYTGKLLEIDLSLADGHVVVPVGVGLEERIAAYQRRVEEGTQKYGMLLGYDAIDDHTGGLHPGEMGALGAGSKVGKSFVLADVAKNSWERGYRAVLFTLENSKDMTLDRIACLGASVDGERFERGTLTDEELDRIKAFRSNMGDEFFVVEPSDDERTPQALHRQAQLLGADGMVVDQLTWVKHPKPDSRRPRNAELAEIMRMFRTEINRGGRMPLLLAHQFKREGIEAAKKRGYHEMSDFADSAEVERAIDFGFGLHQGREAKTVNRMLFQTMAARRVSLKHWILGWRLQHGTISVYHETDLPNSEVPRDSERS